MFAETTEAPQWLLSSWIRSCQAAGATANEPELVAVCRDLLDRWGGEERTYHGLKHLIDVLSHVDELAAEATDPDLVRLAAWYHGAVFSAAAKLAYASAAGEDEVASAALARKQLIELGIPEHRVDKVANMVTKLVRHKVVKADTDCAVLVDADLAILKSDPQRYKQYLSAIRAEYAHIPTEDFLRARLRIVSKLLEREHLFSTAASLTWEDAARQNLVGEQARLVKELARVEKEKALTAEQHTEAK
ncbi:HD domain-containing protein [Timonella sp. A28]|uniref:HD domain-containing protein n=1 Tax=Timonella sp. A28 TaxID=3442640 RepID=UPI003EB8AD53